MTAGTMRVVLPERVKMKLDIEEFHLRASCQSHFQQKMLMRWVFYSLYLHHHSVHLCPANLTGQHICSSVCILQPPACALWLTVWQTDSEMQRSGSTVDIPQLGGGNHVTPESVPHQQQQQWLTSFLFVIAKTTFYPRQSGPCQVEFETRRGLNRVVHIHIQMMEPHM